MDRQPNIDHHLAYMMEQLDTIKSQQESQLNKLDEVIELKEYLRALSIAVQQLCKLIKEAQEQEAKELYGKDDIIIYKGK